MTEDEILSKANEILARRRRQERGREMFSAHSIALTGLLGDFDEHKITIPVSPTPELYALLCRALDVETLEEP